MFSIFTIILFFNRYTIAMSKPINLTGWITQQQLANELGVKVQAVNNWIRRGKINSKHIPELGITLVDKMSITARHYNRSN